MTTEISFNDGQLTVVRRYQANIEDVFDAWIETSKIKQWWGCAECTNVESEVEPKVGGKYNHHMTIDTSSGVHEVPGFATLVEFDPPRRLAYTSTDENDPMMITVDFTETADGATEVRLVHSSIPDMRVEGDIELREVIQAGWTAALGKLDRLMTTSRAA